MDIGLLLYFPLFLLAILLAFYVPGNLFVSRIPLTKFQNLILSINLGMVLWGLEGFLFGYLHARFLTYLYLLITTVFWIKSNYKLVKRPKISFPMPKKETLVLSLFILVAISLPIYSSFANGIKTPRGILFCCQLPDSLFHIALTNELVNTFPPNEPGVAGVVLKNYHFLSNLINADIARVFQIPVLYLQYPYSSLLINLLLALTVLVFAQVTVKKKAYTYWLLFFVFFSGDILYLLSYINLHVFKFDNTVLTDATTIWFSPPRVYGIYLLFSALCFFIVWLKEKKNIFLDIAVAVSFGCLISIKVYFSIFALGGLGILTLLFAYERNYRKLFVMLATFLISLCLYYPVNSGAGGFIFTGFWRYEDFASQKELGMYRMELARNIYLIHGNWIRNLQYHLEYIAIYLLFVFGTLLFGVFQTKKSLSQLPAKLNYLMLTGFVVSFILGSFFIQQTGGANTTQFLITNLMVLPIYAALAVTYWLGKIKKKFVVVLLTALIVLFTIPRVIYATVHHYFVGASQSIVVDTDEMQAMEWVKKNTPQNAVFLQDKYNYCLQFSIITNRQTYMCDDASPEDHGENLKTRGQLQNDVMQYDNSGAIKLLAINHDIAYLYFRTRIYNKTFDSFVKYGYPIVFQNKEITILKNPVSAK